MTPRVYLLGGLFRFTWLQHFLVWFWYRGGMSSASTLWLTSTLSINEVSAHTINEVRQKLDEHNHLFRQLKIAQKNFEYLKIAPEALFCTNL